MELTQREKAVALVSNGIAVYSVYLHNNTLPKGTTMFDFILKTIPEDLKSEINMELIDAVYEYVSSAHS